MMAARAAGMEVECDAEAEEERAAAVVAYRPSAFSLSL